MFKIANFAFSHLFALISILKPTEVLTMLVLFATEEWKEDDILFRSVTKGEINWENLRLFSLCPYLLDLIFASFGWHAVAGSSSVSFPSVWSNWSCFPGISGLVLWKNVGVSIRSTTLLK